MRGPGSIKRRLESLEARARPDGPEEVRERERWRARIREEAERGIGRARREGKEPVFGMAEDGGVFCARDGRPVTAFHQTLAEELYRQQVERHEPGADPLVHDEEGQAFYTPEGQLALSRTFCDLGCLFRYG